MSGNPRNKYGQVADLSSDGLDTKNDAISPHPKLGDAENSDFSPASYPYFARFGYCENHKSDDEFSD